MSRAWNNNGYNNQNNGHQRYGNQNRNNYNNNNYNNSKFNKSSSSDLNDTTYKSSMNVHSKYNRHNKKKPLIMPCNET